MKKNSVLLLISNLEYGGAQRQLLELANNIDRSKYNVYVCSLSDYVPLASMLIDKNTLHIIKKYHKYDVTVVYRLMVLLKKLNIDIAHSYLFDADIATRLAGMWAKTKLVINSERNTEYYLKNVQLMAYKKTYNLVDYIIANSQSGANFNSRILGYDKAKYRVVYNGVNIDRFKHLNKIESRKKYNLPQDKFIIGMFASLKEQKNHSMLIRVAKETVKEHDNVRFLLVGDMLHAGMHGSDEYAENIKEMIIHSGLSRYFIQMGNQDVVEEVYNTCDITVLPSNYEGMPNVVLESMSCGIPVIVTDVSDNKHIITDEYDGILVGLDKDKEMIEGIKRLINEKYRMNMAKNARNTILDKFTNKHMSINTENIYNELLELVST